MNLSVMILEPGKVEVAETEMPVCREGEALLRVIYGGICGTDLNSYKGTFAYVTYPRIIGHEFSAEILEISSNDRGLKEGMIVTCNPYFNCGRCYSCRRGLVNCCENNQTMGVQREGAFAQYITMPVERIYDGNGLSARKLALIEPFSIGLHAVRRASPKPNEKIMIMGAGTIGCMAALAAQQYGAEVVISDISETKLNLAKNLGIKNQIVNRNPQDLKEQTDLYTNGNGFDIVVEAVGLPSTFQSCIDSSAFGGRVVQVGVGKRSLDFHFTVIQKKELNVFGSRNASKADFEYAIDVVKNHKLLTDIENVITNEYGFEDAHKGFQKYELGADGMLKVILRF